MQLCRVAAAVGRCRQFEVVALFCVWILMRRALMDGRMHWEGASVWQDAYWIVRNKHPLVSLCCTHRQHPFGSCERFLVLSASVAARGFLSTIIVGTFLAEGAGPRVVQGLAIVVAILEVLFNMFLTHLAVLDDKCCASCQCWCKSAFAQSLRAIICTTGGGCWVLFLVLVVVHYYYDGPHCRRASPRTQSNITHNVHIPKGQSCPVPLGSACLLVPRTCLHPLCAPAAPGDH